MPSSPQHLTSSSPHLSQGLGKTLQASCIMGAALLEEQAAAATAAAAAAAAALAGLPSTTGSVDGSGPPAAATVPPLRACRGVCPSTLVAHWAHEVGRFVSRGVLRPLQYQGTPGERLRLQVSACERALRQSKLHYHVVGRR